MFRLLTQYHVHHLPVVRAEERLLGVVTATDSMNAGRSNATCAAGKTSVYTPH